ncbi:EamA-like transporter family protein [Nitzschia inconspicua]|uniref:EamA-like transporter family protein n=1 Tax=Nitzschia inconspicua TaxID=303405 RepID=A0A9K3PGD9_9STRA|nr:EamA-like transporter family protein [Nitzschia inconspicua]
MSSVDHLTGEFVHGGARNTGGFAGTLTASLREGSEMMFSSVKAIEKGALTRSADRWASRTISARLGGYTDSVRVAEDISLAIPDEKTGLLGKADERDLLDYELTHGPPLIKWIFPALLCALSYALYNIFIKKGSYSIHPILGGVILQFVAAFSGTLLLLFLLARGKSSEIFWDKWGLIWSVGAGLWVGTAEMLSFTVSGMGVPATQSIPIIIGGSVLFGAVLGFCVLGEVLVLHGWSGVVLLTLGIGLVATDPGDKMEEGGGGGDNVDAPPTYLWIGLSLCCAMSYALYNICIKKGSASINPILGGVVLQFIAAIFGSVLLGGILLEGSKLNADQTGIVWASLAGIAVGSAELLSFGVSGMGVQATQSIPILIGGSVMFGAVLGIFMLGETLELQGWIGVLLLMSGIGMVATDPGEKMPGH